MRPYLNDPRAFYVFRHWKRGGGVGGEYGMIGEFRQWVAGTTNHFFNVLQVWPDEYIAACCADLVIPMPDELPFLRSFSEDEAICQSH